MFHGTKEEQKALTQELRDLTLMARGLGSRLQMLQPHTVGSDDYVKIQESVLDADNIAGRLADLYPMAIKHLEASSESR